MKPLVLITRRYPTDVLASLAGSAKILMPATDDSVFGLEAVKRQEGRIAAIITQGDLSIDAELLAAAPHLRIVANAAIGTNNLAIDLMRERKVWGTNTPEAFVDATADCTLAHLLVLARRLGEADRFVRAGKWKRFEPGRWDGVLLRGKTLGIVGFGRIGRAVAVRAAAFGLKVIHHNSRGSAHTDWRPLERLLAESDIVSLHLPLTPATHGVINATRLAQMKLGAWLLNVARGPLIDEAALVAALQSGRLAGAALDVFADEPEVPPALREMENVVLSPHLGGGSHEGRRQAQELCVDNVLRVLSGEQPRPECVIVKVCTGESDGN
jgi:glyoxylate reductase